MVRRWVLGGILLLMCVSVAIAKPGVVRTTDGRSIEGDITDKGEEGVVIVTKAATIGLKREQVAAIEYAANVREMYQQRVKALPKDAGAKAHVEIARWLYEKAEYELARGETEVALNLDASNADAIVLKQTIDRTIAMQRPGTTPAVTPKPLTRPVAGVATPALKERRLLDNDQINILRQKEWREGDVVGVRLERDVKQRFVEYDRGDVRAFQTLPDVRKAWLILTRGSPEMATDVRLLTDPQPLAEFKKNIQPPVLSGCATLQCHGGAKAGKFALHYPADTNAATYTNFYILSRYHTQVGEVDQKMIDRAYPSRSLLLQFGLPRDRAESKHPDVPNFAPAYRNAQSARMVEEWIKNSLSPQVADYGIDFPVGGGTAAPAASQPADPPKKEEPKPAPAPAPAAKEQPAQPKGNEPTDPLKEIRQRMRPTPGL